MKQKAIITGASTGIGKYFAIEMAKRNYDVVINARDTAKLNELKKEIEKEYKVKCETYPADLSKDVEYKKFATKYKNDKSVSVLFNNAGIGYAGDFLNQDENVAASMVDLNCSCLTYLTNIFVKKFVKEGRGKIINIASIASYFPIMPRNAAYSASKHYVRAFSRSVNFELRKAGHKNVTVAALCPGAIQTQFYKTSKWDDEKLKLTPADKFAELACKKMIDGNKVFYTSGKGARLTKIGSRILSQKRRAKIAYRLVKTTDKNLTSNKKK